ncbi:hypothetical protein [Cellulophaga sp. Ld12]|uniref:hypothetical protein n=1 Tax=Cellulophaga sp. Ld12 TaxID=3229535 RepID=UPI003863E1C5
MIDANGVLNYIVGGIAYEIGGNGKGRRKGIDCIAVKIEGIIKPFLFFLVTEEQ